MSRGKVLIGAPVHAILTEGLEAAGYECVFQEQITQQSAYELIGDCTGIITSTRLQLDEDLLSAAPLLKWIGRMGSGMEVIDLPFAESRGIVCFSSPEGNSNAVAEHTLGLLLSLTKKINFSAREVEQGVWNREENRGIELEGRTIAIIGFGHTGRSFAKKLQGFDMKILAYDTDASVEVPGYVTKCAHIDEVFARAEIISFHVPLKNDTFAYLNRRFIEQMQRPFILINTSRGKVLDTAALVDGLTSGKITAAGLDVWEEEPFEKMSIELKKTLNYCLSMPQVLLTPHVAGYSKEALYKMSKALLAKIVTIR